MDMYEAGQMDALGQMTPDAICESVKDAGERAMNETLDRIMRQHGCTGKGPIHFALGVKCVATEDEDEWEADLDD